MEPTKPPFPLGFVTCAVMMFAVPIAVGTQWHKHIMKKRWNLGSQKNHEVVRD